MSVDPLPHPRTQAVMHLSSMLRDKPEQESNILRLLVNKLVRSHFCYALDQSSGLTQTFSFSNRATRTARSRPKLRTTCSKSFRLTRA